MSIKKILIRVDSSYTIGTGHLMRTLVLAERYSNAEIIFASRKLRGNCNHLIEEAGYTLTILHTHTFAELDTLVKQNKIDLLVIDHYEIDYRFEKQLKFANKELQLMVLDDLYKKHYCDILLNHNIYADATQYKGLLKKECELLCGERYTLLRKEFLEPKTFKVMVAMGGADTQNISAKIVQTLLHYPFVKINLISTRANINLEKLYSFAKKSDRVSLHVETQELANLARQSDFSIISASVLANELYSMKIPFIAISTARNQKYMVKFLQERNYRVIQHFDAKVLHRLIEEYFR